MTDYGKKKCELLEKKGFEANNLAWWIVGENEQTRTYAYVSKKVGSVVKMLTISTTDAIAEINDSYKKLLETLKEYKGYLKENYGKNEVDCCDAETSNTMDYVSTLASRMDTLNYSAYDIECGLPWSEISDIFDSDDNDEWYLKDETELFGEES